MKKYLGIFLSLFIFTTIGLSIYQKITKKEVSAKSRRISCQKKTTTFEKIIDKDLAIKAIKLLKSGNYNLHQQLA